MTDERFNELLNGPLSHPFPMFGMTRLILALRHVVESTGEAGEQALEEHCRRRDERDSGVGDVDAGKDWKDGSSEMEDGE